MNEQTNTTPILVDLMVARIGLDGSVIEPVKRLAIAATADWKALTMEVLIPLARLEALCDVAVLISEPDLWDGSTFGAHPATIVGTDIGNEGPTSIQGTGHYEHLTGTRVAYSSWQDRRAAFDALNDHVGLYLVQRDRLGANVVKVVAAMVLSELGREPSPNALRQAYTSAALALEYAARAVEVPAAPLTNHVQEGSPTDVVEDDVDLPRRLRLVFERRVELTGKTYAEVAQFTEADMLQITGIGEVAVATLRVALLRRDLRFRDV